MENQNEPGDRQYRTVLNPLEEAAIQAIAQRIGLRISQEIISALGEMVVLIRETQKTPSTSQAEIAPPEMPDIMIVGDVAKLLRLSRAKVYRMIQRKEMSAIVIDSSVRVRREDLDNFIKQHSGS